MRSVNEWPMVKLGEVSEVVSGGTPKTGEPSFWDGGVPWVTPADLGKNSGLTISEGEKFISQDGLKKSSAVLIPAGSVVLSSRAPIGHIAINTQPLATNQGCKSFVPSQDLNASYLAHYLIHIRGYLQQMGTGATFKELSRTRAQEIPVPLPPLDEQQRIAKILDSSQQQFGFLEAKKAHLPFLRAGIIDQILDADDRETLPLKEIAEIQSGITKGRKVRVGETLTETPYMAVSNVKDGYLDLQAVKTIPVTEAEIIRFRLQAGDILLTEGGDPDKLGRGTVWREEIETCLHQNHIFRVRLPEDSQFTPEALKAMLSTKQARAYFFRSAKQTTGIASINKTQLSAVPVPILTSTEITRLSEILTQIDALSETINERWKATEDLHHSLSTRAFAGQL